ncbi:hypothetical protein CHS0354_008381 [Potamilus streckersoni]|uniref:Uncharacterized protein n=1 Tax=Potamilus streckersoni TaxID=2493646 RepID=A0AAE0VGP5_9BIVA|nr:hypothetical protein CHS0354_008381 [Potamilus streckersoni]
MVSIFLTLVASKWVGDIYVNLHLQKTNFDHFGYCWFIEGEYNGVGVLQIVVTLDTSVTPSFFIPSMISVSVTSAKSRQRRTPLDVFNVVWANDDAGISKNVFIFFEVFCLTSSLTFNK